MALLDPYINFTYYPGLNSQGLQKPFLAMSSTIIHPKLFDLSPASQRLYTLATQDATWLRITHTGHFAFSDCAWTVDMTAASRPGAVAINACLAWFFDTYLRGDAPPFPAHPEIFNVQRK